MIPKVIHYCWFGGMDLPQDAKKCIQSWKKFCPDYEIRQWDESNFDVHCHPFVESAYEAGAWAFVSDYARLKIIYDEGGIYLDTDVELLKNLDFLLENPCYIGVQQSGRLCTTGLGFGAAKASPVVHSMLEEYNGLVYSKEKQNQMICPRLNSAVIKKLGYVDSDDVQKLEEVLILPTRFMDPLSPGTAESLVCEDTISIHHYAASWMSFRNRMKRKIVRFIGQENIMKMKSFQPVFYGMFFILLIFNNVLCRFFPPLRYADELIAIMGGVYLLTRWRDVIYSRYKWILAAVLSVIVVGLLGNVIWKMQPQTIAVLKDMLAFSKVPVSIMAFGIWSKEHRSEAALEAAYQISRIFLSVYFIFGILSLFWDIGLSRTGDVRMGLRSYKFLFSHPTFLVFSVVIMVSVMVAHEIRRQDIIFHLAALGVLFLSLRDKAFAFIVLYIVLIIIAYKISKFRWWHILIAVAGAFIISLGKILTYISYSWSPREALYSIGLKLVQDCFPVGSGFGTFACAISGEYYSRVYEIYGIAGKPGVNPENFVDLGDVQWPYYYGEFGLWGMIAIGFVLIILYKVLMERYDMTKWKTKAVYLLLGYLAIASLVEAVFTNESGVFSIVILFVFLGRGESSASPILEKHIP